MGSQQSREVGRVGGEGREGQERRGSTIAQVKKDFLRYVLCGCIGEDQETPVDEHQETPVDEHHPLLAGEDRTHGASGSSIEDHSIETSNNADNRDKEELTQNFQAAKTRIDDYLEKNPQSLKKEKAEFERISAHLSKWIKHAKEGIEMDCVSSLAKELSEMRLDSDFANNLSTMRTAIVQLAGGRGLIENFQAAKTRIDDYLEKNPGFLDEGQRKEYEKRVNQFSENIKSGELERGMEHASHVLDILRKISEAKPVKTSSEVEQPVTLAGRREPIENFHAAKTRIDDYLKKNPGFLDEGQREEYKKRVNQFSEDVKSSKLERGMEHASHVLDILHKIEVEQRISKWIKHAKEGEEMECVSSLAKELSEMRLDSDFANNLSTMLKRIKEDHTIEQLDVRSEQIENFHAVTTRINDYLKENPEFLDEGQRKEYEKRVNQFSEDVKSSKLERGMEHASHSHILNILHKIEVEQRISRCRKHAKEGEEMECVSSLAKELSEMRLDSDFANNLSTMLKRIKEDHTIERLDVRSERIENFHAATTRINDYLKENPEFLDQEQREEYDEMVEQFSEDVESSKLKRGMEHASHSHILNILYKIPGKVEQPVTNENMVRKKIKASGDSDLRDMKEQIRKIFEKMFEEIKKDSRRVHNKIVEFRRNDNQDGIDEARKELENLEEVKKASESILDDILEGEMTFGEVKEFDPRITLVRDYQRKQQIKDFEMKKIRNQTLNESYSVRGEGGWSKEMADAFALSWLRAYWQESIMSHRGRDGDENGIE